MLEGDVHSTGGLLILPSYEPYMSSYVEMLMVHQWHKQCGSNQQLTPEDETHTQHHYCAKNLWLGLSQAMEGSLPVVFC